MGQTLKVLAKSDKKCRFFINGEKNLHFYILTSLKQQTFEHMNMKWIEIKGYD